MLQNAHRNLWTISQLDLSGIEVQLGSLGSGNIVEGQSWSGGYLLYLPLTDTCAYAANGTVLDKHSFMILEPGCEFCISTKAEHDWCSIFVPADKFVRGGDLVQPSSGFDKMKCRVSPANRLLADQFRSIVDQIITAAGNCRQIETGPAAACAAAELLGIASVVLGQQQAGEAHHDGPRPCATQFGQSRGGCSLRHRHRQVFPPGSDPGSSAIMCTSQLRQTSLRQ